MKSPSELLTQLRELGEMDNKARFRAALDLSRTALASVIAGVDTRLADAINGPEDET